MGASSFAAAFLATLCAIAPQRAVADLPWYSDRPGYQAGVAGMVPSQGFYSSDAKASLFQVNTFDADRVDTDAGYMFMTGKLEGWGPSIYSSKDLSLVWAGTTHSGLAQAAHTFENFMGQRVMAVFVDGAVRIYDQSYKELYAVRPGGDLGNVYPDGHESFLTDDDTVLMIICPPAPVDLSPLGGPAEGKTVSNCHATEIDPVTHEVLFDFVTLDHFTIEDSYYAYRGEENWDFCHMNSIYKLPDGNFLVSYRHLSTILLVDGKTRQPIWRMGGKRNMFTDISEGHSAEFHYQHEPRPSGPNRFTIFDNHRLDNGFCKMGQCSRGLELEYDSEALTVKWINEWTHPQRLVSASRGGVQKLPGGNVLLAWGQNPMYTEYTAEGDIVMDFQRGQVLTIEHGIFDIVTYRIWKGDWDATPSWGPSIAVHDDERGKHLYVSWNGATKVHQWVLMMDDDMDKLDGSGGAHSWSARLGFETEFTPSEVKKYARIAALDIHGKILGATPAIDSESGERTELDSDVKGISLAGGEKNENPRPPISPFWIATGVVVFSIAALAVFMNFWRRRKARLAAAETGEESDTQYGLLMSEGLDQNERESFEDDEEDEVDGLAKVDKIDREEEDDDVSEIEVKPKQ